MSKLQSVVVTARKHNKQNRVVKPNRKKEMTMKNKSTDSNTFLVEGNAEVVVNTRITGQLSLKLKKLAVTASLGLVAIAASLP
jgi:hypothetical protein